MGVRLPRLQLDQVSGCEIEGAARCWARCCDAKDWKLGERYSMNIIADVNAGCRSLKPRARHRCRLGRQNQGEGWIAARPAALSDLRCLHCLHGFELPSSTSKLSQGLELVLGRGRRSKPRQPLKVAESGSHRAFVPRWRLEKLGGGGGGGEP